MPAKIKRQSFGRSPSGRAAELVPTKVGKPVAYAQSRSKAHRAFTVASSPAGGRCAVVAKPCASLSRISRFLKLKSQITCIYVASFKILLYCAGPAPPCSVEAALRRRRRREPT